MDLKFKAEPMTEHERPSADAPRTSREESVVRQRAEHALAQSEERAQLLLQASNDGIWDWNLTTGVTIWTERVYTMLGILPNGAPPQLAGLAEWVHPEDRTRFQAFLDKLGEAQADCHVELRLRTADGNFGYFTLQGKVLRDAAGTPVRAIGSLSDVTARRLAENALRESEQRHRALVSVLTSIVWRTDAQGNFVEPQLSWEAYTGQSWERHAGQGWLAAIHPDDRPEVVRLWSSAMERQHIYESEGRLWHASSSRFRYFAARAVPMFTRDGTVREWVGVIRDIDDHKRAENDLRRSEDRLRQQAALIDLTHDAILVWDRRRKITFWNQGAVEMYGFTADEAIGTDIRSLLQTKYPEPLEEIDRTLESSGHWKGQLLHRRKDGVFIAVESRWRVLRDASSQSPSVMETCHDVTARRAAEDALRASEERFRTMADAAPVMIWIASSGKNRTYFNWGWLEFTGRNMEQEAGEGWTQVVHPDDLGRCLECYRWAFDRREPFTVEFRMRRADGEFRWMLDNGVPLLGAEDAFQGYIGSVIDITDRKRSENKLREAADYLVEQRQWLESVLNLLPMPMLLIDPASARVTFSNRAARQTAHLFSAAHREDADVEFLRDAHGDRLSERDGPVSLVSRGERLRGFEVQWHRSDGIRSMIVNSEMLPAMHSHERVAVLLYQDITNQKQVEADLRRANQAKDALLAMLGHELRNPLAAITSAAELLELLDPGDAAFAAARDILHTHIQHLVQLVDDMLDVSRLTSGKIRIRHEALDLREIVRHSLQTCESVIDAGDHQLSLDLPTDPMRVDGDAARLEQVFVNLLTNAAKYTETGGRITVSGELTASEAVVRVRDTGVGIRPDLLPQVFDLFRQLNPSLHRAEGGLGIGLNIVKSLIELHGGSVAAHSDGPNRGSEFVVRLPRTTRQFVAAPQALPVDQTASGPAASFRVLVVEDNADIAHSMVALLRHLGHNVEIAHDGDTALQIALRFAPQVAFLDIGLPGMNGLELAETFRGDERLRSTRLIALTGFGQAEDRRRSLAAGFDEHLVKPLNFARLQETLARFAAP